MNPGQVNTSEVIHCFIRCYRTTHLFSSSVNRGLIRQGFKYLEICKKLLERFSWPYYNRFLIDVTEVWRHVTQWILTMHMVSGFLHKNTIDRTLEMHKLTNHSQYYYHSNLKRLNLWFVPAFNQMISLVLVFSIQNITEIAQNIVRV